MQKHLCTIAKKEILKTKSTSHDPNCCSYRFYFNNIYKNRLKLLYNTHIYCSMTLVENTLLYAKDFYTKICKVFGIHCGS